jgi:hypothetical protein
MTDAELQAFNVDAQDVIHGSSLHGLDTEPSTEFARLLMRVGTRAGVAVLGLGAIRTLVRKSIGA